MGKKGPKPRPALERFYEKAIDAGDCWVWSGFVRPNGYGQFATESRKIVYAHRWAYEALREPIPTGMELHHLCGNRSCVNPDHLLPVTRKQHVALDRRNIRETTHCPQGHPYDEDNTYVVPGRNHRLCRECRRQRNRERERQRRATERLLRESSA